MILKTRKVDPMQMNQLWVTLNLHRVRKKVTSWRNLPLFPSHLSWHSGGNSSEDLATAALYLNMIPSLTSIQHTHYSIIFASMHNDIHITLQHIIQLLYHIASGYQMQDIFFNPEFDTWRLYHSFTRHNMPCPLPTINYNTMTQHSVMLRELWRETLVIKRWCGI